MDNEYSQPHSDTSRDTIGKNKRRKKRKPEKLQSGKDDTVVSWHLYGLLYLVRNIILQPVIYVVVAM